MAGTPDEIMQLQHRLEEAEKNTIMAATYGKQLLEENHELHMKLEESSVMLESLEQEKHALAFKFEAKVQTEQSLVQEVEQLREQRTKDIEMQVALATHGFENEIQKLNRMLANAKADLEREQSENQQTTERMALMEAQLKKAQDRIDDYSTPIPDCSIDESIATVQSQIMTLTCEKQELEMQVSALSAQAKSNKLKLSQAENNIEALKKEVEGLECQCTSYFNALEQNKEEITELKIEIDTLKLAETDPGKKGNSLFAEVEDQRQVMEKNLQEYKSKYNIMKKQCEMKTQQISKMKMQLANLLSLSNNKADTEYVSHLEESLVCARNQLDTLTKQYQDGKPTDANVVQIQSGNEAEASDEQNMTTFFKKMFMESQKKVDELDLTLRTAQFDKVVLSDRILQLQRKLRQTESSRDATNSRLITLQVKFDELAAKKGESHGNGSKSTKRIAEKIPGFENVSSTKKEKEPIEESRIPLQEKPVNVNVPSEVTIQPKDDICLSKDIGSDNHGTQDPKVNKEEEKQENTVDLCSYEHKKKAKKSVRMTETVVVQECDGGVQEAQMKKEDGVKYAQPKRKVLRKMNAPVVKIPSGGQANECNQQ